MITWYKSKLYWVELSQVQQFSGFKTRSGAVPRQNVWNFIALDSPSTEDFYSRGLFSCTSSNKVIIGIFMSTRTLICHRIGPNHQQTKPAYITLPKPAYKQIVRNPDKKYRFYHDRRTVFVAEWEVEYSCIDQHRTWMQNIYITAFQYDSHERSLQLICESHAYERKPEYCLLPKTGDARVIGQKLNLWFSYKDNTVFCLAQPDSCQPSIVGYFYRHRCFSPMFGNQDGVPGIFVFKPNSILSMVAIRQHSLFLRDGAVASDDGVEFETVSRVYIKF